MPATSVFSEHPLCIVLGTRDEKVIQSTCSQGTYLEELEIQRDNPKTAREFINV